MNTQFLKKSTSRHGHVLHFRSVGFLSSEARRKAFTLVEVVTAMGIAAVGIVTVLTILTQAIYQSRSSGQDTIASNIAYQIYSEFEGCKDESTTESNENGDENFYQVGDGIPDILQGGIKGSVFYKCTPVKKWPTFNKTGKYNTLVLYFDRHGNRFPLAANGTGLDYGNPYTSTSPEWQYEVRVIGERAYKTGSVPFNANDYCRLMISVMPRDTDQATAANTERIPFYFLVKRP